MKKTYSIILSLFSILSYAQVLITDGQDPTLTSENDIVLELKSINADKGLLLPRLVLQSINSSLPLSSHKAGILVYNTNISDTSVTPVNYVYPGLYYNDGYQWIRLSSHIKPDIGDIKYSALNTDHDGWYLLNGRNISVLGSIPAQNAASIGFSVVLPDISDRFLKANSDTEISGSLGGNSNITISQANLPNVTFSGTTNSTGSHSHSYNDRANGTATSEEVNNVSRVDNPNNSTKTTSSAGAHSHSFSVSTGGENEPINFTPPFLSSYVFVYLGE